MTRTTIIISILIAYGVIVANGNGSTNSSTLTNGTGTIPPEFGPKYYNLTLQASEPKTTVNASTITTESTTLALANVTTDSPSMETSDGAASNESHTTTSHTSSFLPTPKDSDNTNSTSQSPRPPTEMSTERPFSGPPPTLTPASTTVESKTETSPTPPRNNNGTTDSLINATTASPPNKRRNKISAWVMVTLTSLFLLAAICTITYIMRKRRPQSDEFTLLDSVPFSGELNRRPDEFDTTF